MEHRVDLLNGTRIFRAWLIALTVICGCAFTSTVRDSPLNAGESQTYAADFDRVLVAAKQATTEAGLKIDRVDKLDENTWVIIAKKGISAWSWGELVRVAVINEDAHHTTVRVLTKRKLATNVTAKGDYSNPILSNTELILRSR